jgi:mono/diheme cytochrome c family protein
MVDRRAALFACVAAASSLGCSAAPSVRAVVIDPGGGGEARAAVEDGGTETLDAGTLIAGGDEADAGTVAIAAPGPMADAGAPAEDATPPIDAAGDEEADDGRALALVRRGRRAYEAHCDTCHEDGPELRGRHLAASRVRRQVRHGGSRMRAIPTSRLSDADLEAIVAYLER